MTKTIVITHLRELDTLIAERVMYIDVWNGVDNYSTDIASAWQVVEKLASFGLVVEIRHNSIGKFQLLTWLEKRGQGFNRLRDQPLLHLERTKSPAPSFIAALITGVNTWRETKQPERLVLDSSAPMAICLAALQAIGIEVELKL